MITLKQINEALTMLGLNTNSIDDCISILNGVLAELDEVEVKGRQNVDRLLGCMMAVEAIIGKEGENG